MRWEERGLAEARFPGNRDLARAAETTKAGPRQGSGPRFPILEPHSLFRSRSRLSTSAISSWS